MKVSSEVIEISLYVLCSVHNGALMERGRTCGFQNLVGTSVHGGHNLPPLVEKGLWQLPKFGGDQSPCPHVHWRAWNEDFSHRNNSLVQNPLSLWTWGHGDWFPPSFGSPLNPFSTKRADYAHPVLMSPPSFESHRRAWNEDFSRRTNSLVQNPLILAIIMRY